MNAKEVLLGIRLTRKDPIVREVVINDPLQNQIYARYRADLWPNIYTDEHFAAQGIQPVDEVPEGWRPTTAVFRRRVDALMFGARGLTAIEIKVTRPDFFADTAEKRGPWMDVTDFFVYATPPGLVTPDEVPKGCGLWEVEPIYFTPQGRMLGAQIKTVKRAVRNKGVRPLPDQVMKALTWRLSNRERQEELG